jgi:hypothetical protein
MTREQMIAEFGRPGVENPTILDLVTTDPATGDVVLVMIERRRWGDSALQVPQIEEKINRYMGYVLDGYLADHYPKYAGKRVRLRLECAEAPHGHIVRFLSAAEHAAGQHGLGFEVKVTGGTDPAPGGAPGDGSDEAAG